MSTPQEVADFFAFLLPTNEHVVTVWADGTWKVWRAMDAFYAQSDPGYLVTIALKDIAEARVTELEDAMRLIRRWIESEERPGDRTMDVYNMTAKVLPY